MTSIHPRRILIIVPYKARDLDGLGLVAYLLEKRYGHQVFLSNAYGVEKKLLTHKVDALVIDHLVWDFKVEQAKLAKSLGMKVFVLPTEGFHQNKEEARWIAGKLTKSSHIADCHFAWGDFVRDAVLHEGLAVESQVHTIGCPRFDLYREPYLSLMSPRSQFLKRLGVQNPSGPVILWATNTTYASRNLKKMVRRKVLRGNLPKAEIWASLEDEVTQFREHSSLVLELAKRHPGWNFVVKVHPAEWINPYVDLTKKATNLHLAFDAPIYDFLFHCDVLLQRGCTTATEAWMLRKPVLELEVGRFNNPKRMDYVTGNHIVTSIDEADAAIKQYVSGSEIPKEQLEAREAFIEDFYYRVDGFSSGRCAEIINREISAPSYTDEDQLRVRTATTEIAERRSRFEANRLINKIKDLLGISRQVSLRFWKGLTRREAEDNLGMFVAEAEITPEMVAEVYRRYDTVLGARRELAVRAS